MKNKLIKIAFCTLLFYFNLNDLKCQNNSIDTVKRNSIHKPILSAEIYATYPYYFFTRSNYNMEFNYCFGGAISIQPRHVKFTLGFNYSTKKYFQKYYNNYYFDKISYKSNYYNIPLTINFSLFNKDFKKKNDVIIGIGMIWNIPRKYEADIYYNHPLPYPNPYKFSDLGIGLSIPLIIRYQKYLSKYFNFFISSSGIYKLYSEYTYTPSMMSIWEPTFSKDKYLFEIKIGLEWSINK